MERARGEDVGSAPGWRGWLARLAAFEEAVFLSEGEIQDRRIARLEAEVAELRASVERVRLPMIDR